MPLRLAVSTLPRRSQVYSAGAETARHCRRLLTTASKDHDIPDREKAESRSGWNIPPLDKTTALSPHVFGVPDSTKPHNHWTQDENASFNRIVSAHLVRNRNISRSDWIKYSRQFRRRTHLALRSRYDSSPVWLTKSYRQHLKGWPSARMPKSNTDQSASKLQTIVRWSATEDDALRTAIAIYGPRKWKLVADLVGTRNHIQCRGRWQTLTSPHQGTWGPILQWAQDMHQRRRRKAMFSSLGRDGTAASVRSSIVATLLDQQYRLTPDRIAAAGASVGASQIQPLNGRTLLRPFLAEEDQALLRLVRTYGARWAMIAGMLTKRFALPACTTDKGGMPAYDQPRTPRIVYKRYYDLIYSQIKPSVQNKASTGTLADSSPGRVYQNQKHAGSRNPYRRWTDDEISTLTRIIESMIQSERGFTSWVDVARKMKPFNRTPVQCRYFWMLRGGTHLRHTPFTAAEDKMLWPFVVDCLPSDSAKSDQQRQNKLYGRNITATYKQDSGRPASVVGIGWLSAGPMVGRSTRMIRVRIRRLQHIIEWLRVFGRVDRPERLFDLVHGLADCPSSFRIGEIEH